LGIPGSEGAAAVKSVLTTLLVVLACGAALCAQQQSSPASASRSTPSLGELARKLRAEHKAQSAKPAKVFTNDNIPHRGGISVMGQQPAAPDESSGRAGEKRQERSAAAKDAFKRQQPCPANGNRTGPCPGYVIDHIVPLACGGPDAPSNMQWQTVAEGKAKDKWEREDCGK
jgi:hypothetical protein